MARWEPNAVERLREAAMQLYREPGYDKVTVAEIAARAGVTRRTFFRYFPDKREVLFWGSERVEALVTDGVHAAPEGSPVLEVVAAALAPIAKVSDDDPTWAAYVRARYAIIEANAELRERELAKHALLAAAIGSALERRGVPPITARLAADAGLSAFDVGLRQWLADPKQRKMAKHIADAMRGLGSLLEGTVVLKKARRA